MTSTLSEAAAERAAGGQPSRPRAFVAAAVAAVAAGVLVYKVLRSGGG